MRQELDSNRAQLDEALLSNAFAYIRKCSEDRFDTMVQLLQKFLQLYAAQALAGPEREGLEGALNAVRCLVVCCTLCVPYCAAPCVFCTMSAQRSMLSVHFWKLTVASV